MGCCQSDGASLPTEELTPEEREKRRQERLAAAEHRAKDFKQGGGIKRKKEKKPATLAEARSDNKNALQWTVREMEGRYELMSKAGVRNLAGFNDKAAKYRANGDELVRKVQTGFDERGKPIYETESLPTDHIPNIVVVIDES